MIFNNYSNLIELLALFIKYFPKLFDYYDSTLIDICRNSPECFYPYEDLPFQSYAINVGRQSICRAHIDGENLATGLCLVIPIGTFDHKKGGHLILHELKLILELPSSSIVLFPSAVVTHENVSIGPTEERRSITAFSSASSFSTLSSPSATSTPWCSPKACTKHAQSHTVNQALSSTQLLLAPSTTSFQFL